MGAYYQTQIIDSQQQDTIVIVPDWVKFLESFWFYSNNQQVIFNYLKNHTNANHSVKVATVCDYDNDLPFSFLYDIGRNQSNNAECNAFLNDKNSPDFAVTQGFIVCPETKTAINISQLVKLQKWTLSQMVECSIVCPLALLTRSQKEGQGGGDIGLIEDDTENLIASWYNKSQYYSDTLPADCADITNYIVYAEITPFGEEYIHIVKFTEDVQVTMQANTDLVNHYNQNNLLKSFLLGNPQHGNIFVSQEDSLAYAQMLNIVKMMGLIATYHFEDDTTFKKVANGYIAVTKHPSVYMVKPGIVKNDKKWELVDDIDHPNKVFSTNKTLAITKQDLRMANCLVNSEVLDCLTFESIGSDEFYRNLGDPSYEQRQEIRDIAIGILTDENYTAEMVAPAMTAIAEKLKSLDIEDDTITFIKSLAGNQIVLAGNAGKLYVYNSIDDTLNAYLLDNIHLVSALKHITAIITQRAFEFKKLSALQALDLQIGDILVNQSDYERRMSLAIEVKAVLPNANDKTIGFIGEIMNNIGQGGKQSINPNKGKTITGYFKFDGFIGKVVGIAFSQDIMHIECTIFEKLNPQELVKLESQDEIAS